MFNVVVIFTVFIVGFILLGQFVLPVVPALMGQIMLVLLFCVAMVVGYLIYTKTLKWAMRKRNMGRFIEPLFKRKK